MGSTHTEFREIPGFPGYLVSKDAVVIGRRGHALTPWIARSGYTCVKVGTKAIGVHRAVALAWIENPRRLSDVNHIDGDKQSNGIGNLEWTSRSGNIRHALDTGLHACPETPVVGVNEKTGVGIWARSQAETRAFGFHQSLVNKCLRGERRHTRGFKWSYAA